MLFSKYICHNVFSPFLCVVGPALDKNIFWLKKHAFPLNI